MSSSAFEGQAYTTTPTSEQWMAFRKWIVDMDWYDHDEAQLAMLANGFTGATVKKVFTVDSEGLATGGVLWVEYDDNSTYASTLVVREDYRGRGIGTELAKNVVEGISKAAFAKVHSTPAMLPMYRSIGFAYTGRDGYFYKLKSSELLSAIQPIIVDDRPLNVQPITKSVLKDVVQFDKECVNGGKSRECFLWDFFEFPFVRGCLAATSSGECAGVAAVVPFGSSGKVFKLSPLLAESASVAKKLVKNLLAGLDSESQIAFIVLERSAGADVFVPLLEKANCVADQVVHVLFTRKVENKSDYSKVFFISGHQSCDWFS